MVPDLTTSPLCLLLSPLQACDRQCLQARQSQLVMPLSLLSLFIPFSPFYLRTRSYRIYPHFCLDSGPMRIQVFFHSGHLIHDDSNNNHLLRVAPVASLALLLLLEHLHSPLATHILTANGFCSRPADIHVLRSSLTACLRCLMGIDLLSYGFLN